MAGTTGTTTNNTRTRTIIHKAGTGKKVARAFGYVILSICLFWLCAAAMVGSVSGVSNDVLASLFVSSIGLSIALGLIIGSRDKKQVITEQISDESQGSSNQNTNNNGGLWTN